MMQRRIMLPCSLWLLWSVPSRAKSPKAVKKVTDDEDELLAFYDFLPERASVAVA